MAAAMASNTAVKRAAPTLTAEQKAAKAEKAKQLESLLGKSMGSQMPRRLSTAPPPSVQMPWERRSSVVPSIPASLPSGPTAAEVNAAKAAAMLAASGSAAPTRVQSAPRSAPHQPRRPSSVGDPSKRTAPGSNPQRKRLPSLLPGSLEPGALVAPPNGMDETAAAAAAAAAATATTAAAATATATAATNSLSRAPSSFTLSKSDSITEMPKISKEAPLLPGFDGGGGVRLPAPHLGQPGAAAASQAAASAGSAAGQGPGSKNLRRIVSRIKGMSMGFRSGGLV